MDKYSLYDCGLAESDGFVIFGFDEDYTLDGRCYMNFQGCTAGGHNYFKDDLKKKGMDIYGYDFDDFMIALTFYKSNYY